MGENAKRYSDGRQVKVGTCENMYYLRFDQRHLVGKVEHSLDVNDPGTVGELRFRFPFPDEDKILPGEFPDHDRGAEVPVTPDCTDSHAHGCGRGFAKVVQQRLVDGKLVTIVRCSGDHCFMACWRLGTLDDARPVITACLDKAGAALAQDDRVAARFWMDMAKRVRAGYDHSEPPRAERATQAHVDAVYREAMARS